MQLGNTSVVITQMLIQTQWAFDDVDTMDGCVYARIKNFYLCGKATLYFTVARQLQFIAARL